MLNLNLIWSSYFDYLVYCNDFVMNFVYFFVLVIFLYNLSYMVIEFSCNWHSSEVVFLNCCCCIHFCSVDFDLFSCTDRMIYLVLYIFEVCFDCPVVFVYIQKYYVRIVGNNYTSF